MKCNQCNTEYKAKRSTSQYCSDRCRKLAFLVKGKVSVPEDMFLSVPGQVYGRQAVHYHVDDFDTRPEPLDPTDTPKPGNRCKYTRADGSEYQFDCLGHVFGLTSGSVYPTTEDVHACYLSKTA